MAATQTDPMQAKIEAYSKSDQAHADLVSRALDLHDDKLALYQEIADSRQLLRLLAANKQIPVDIVNALYPPKQRRNGDES